MKTRSNTFGAVFAFIQFALCVPLLQAADVIIIAGQSNAWRLGQIAKGPLKLAHPIHHYTRGCANADGQLTPTCHVLNKLNPNSYGAALAKGMMDELDDELVIVHLGRCGSPIGFPGLNPIKAPGRADGTMTWYAGDDPKAGKFYNDGLYADFLTYYSNAKSHFQKTRPGKKWNLRAIFWHQGEGDCRVERAPAYEINLRNLLYRFRTDFPLVPFIAGEIRDKDPAGNVWPNPEASVVNQGINTIANDASVPQFYVVETSDVPFLQKNPKGKPPVYNVHMGGPGMKKMGARMVATYKKAAALHKQTKPPEKK